MAVFYTDLLDKHTSIPANTMFLTQIDTDLENNIFPHFAYAVLHFYMPAGTDERTQMCQFSNYTEQKDW